MITNCHLKKCLISWVSELLIYTGTYLKQSDNFCLHFVLYLHVWILIRIQNKNSDPGSSWIRIQYGSGSTTLAATLTCPFVVIVTTMSDLPFLLYISIHLSLSLTGDAAPESGWGSPRGGSGPRRVLRISPAGGHRHLRRAWIRLRSAPGDLSLQVW